MKGTKVRKLVFVFLLSLLTVSLSVGSPIFIVNYALSGSDKFKGDIWLNGVDYDKNGIVDKTSSDFIYASRIVNYTYTNNTSSPWNLPYEPWVSLGSKTTAFLNNVAPKQDRLYAQDGNLTDLTSTDMQLFNSKILGAYSNNNLNHYLDHYYGYPSRSYRFDMFFAEDIYDNDSKSDIQGELLYFERGGNPNGGNSDIMLSALDRNGNIIGNAFYAKSSLLTPVTNVELYWPNGGSDYGQRMSGLVIDLSSAFGLTRISGLRVYNPTSNQDSDAFETAADAKIFAIRTIKVNEPSSFLMMGLSLASLVGILFPRRRNKKQ